MKSNFARPVSQIALALLALVLVLGASGCGAQSVMPGGSSTFASVEPSYTDLAYATESDAQKLDLYVPEGTGPFPVVIMVHGGGFMFGIKPMGPVTGVDQLLAAGMLWRVSTIGYGEGMGSSAGVRKIQSSSGALRAGIWSAWHHLRRSGIGR
ncbi:MAG: hypothetical protein IPO22_03905 [Anaerolineales bacterium]|nr:hypothetical protein [Anaerolineales bacterium]